MGADLLLTALVHDEATKLNWPAGRRVIQAMDPDLLMARLEEAHGTPPDTLTEARQEANAILSKLKQELKNTDARDAYTWKIRGAVMHIRGGTSWGEDPSEGWTAFVDAYYFPDALGAIGFDVTGGQ